MKTCRPSTCQRKHSFKICPKKKARWSTQFQWCCKGREAQQRTTETNPSISSNLTSISTIHHSLVAPVDVASPNSLAPTGTKRAHSAARLIQSLPRACPKGCTESFLPWKSTPASCLTAWTAKSSVSNSLGCQNMSCDLSTMLKNQGKTTTARTASTFFQHLSNSASLLGRIELIQKPRCYFATVSRTTTISITEDARERDWPNSGGQFQQSSWLGKGSCTYVILHFQWLGHLASYVATRLHMATPCYAAKLTWYGQKTQVLTGCATWSG